MRAVIIIHPFGKVPGDLLEAVRAAIERRFGVRTSLGRSLTLPGEAYSPERRQYRAQLLLEELAKGALDDGRVRLGSELSGHFSLPTRCRASPLSSSLPNSNRAINASL